MKLGCMKLNGQQCRPFSSVPMPKDEVVQTVLTNWIRKWVIGNGLCPWAAGVMSENKLDVIVVRLPYEDEHLEEIYEAILEAAVNVMGPVTPTETSLVALSALTDFPTFLELVADIEEILEENELTSDIQLATFHPEYQFAGTEVADVTNYTNRSPYPVIQLLRVPQVTEAIARVNGNTDFVWKNNIKRMKLLGLTEVKRLQAEIFDQAAQEGGEDKGVLDVGERTQTDTASAKSV